VAEELLVACDEDVEEITGLVDTVCDELVEVTAGVDVRAKYPPTAAIMITTTTTAATEELIAFRPLPVTLGPSFDNLRPKAKFSCHLPLRIFI
jgi:hypothetical protein